MTFSAALRFRFAQAPARFGFPIAAVNLGSRVPTICWRSRWKNGARRALSLLLQTRRQRCCRQPLTPNAVHQFRCLGRHFRLVFQRLREGASSVGRRADSIGFCTVPRTRDPERSGRGATVRQRALRLGATSWSESANDNHGDLSRLNTYRSLKVGSAHPPQTHGMSSRRSVLRFPVDIGFGIAEANLKSTCSGITPMALSGYRSAYKSRAD
jgi:hypothetical protein